MKDFLKNYLISTIKHLGSHIRIDSSLWTGTFLYFLPFHPILYINLVRGGTGANTLHCDQKLSGFICSNFPFIP